MHAGHMQHQPRARSASDSSDHDQERFQIDNTSSQAINSDGNAGIESYGSDGEKQPDAPRITRQSKQVSDLTANIDTLCVSTTDCRQDLPPKGLDPLDREVVSRVLRNAPDVPLITKESLSELDLSVIQNNLNLRSDLPYDFDLYFQPITGLRGDEKLRQAAAYWSSIILALKVADMERQMPEKIPNWLSKIDFKSRIKVMLETLKELVEILVPESDMSEVQEYFDVEWQLWRIGIGSFDMQKFSSWIVGLLMRHCAPMRDEFASEIEAELQDGASTGDLNVLVKGIEKLFSLLEAMKLDVANHQIRTFVAILVEDVVPFQRDCFQKMIASDQLSLKSSYEWFRDVKKEFLDFSRSGGVIPSDFACAVFGLSSLCDPRQLLIPSIYQHDAQRLRRLQEDVFDRANLDVCINFYKEKCVGHASDELERHCDSLTTRLMQMMDEDEFRIGNWITANVEVVGTEIARSVCSVNADESDFKLQISQRQITDIQSTIDKLQERLSAERKSQNLVKDILIQLFSRALWHTKKFCSSSTLNLSNVQRQYTLKRSNDQTKIMIPDIEEMSRRVAHMAVLHWRVWGDLFYGRGVDQLFIQA